MEGSFRVVRALSAANSPRRGTAPFLTGVFLICMCGLMLQIVQTRVISVIVYYHLAFFAISMAMLGMTAGALVVYFKPKLFSRERLFEHLGWIGAAFAISIVLSTLSLITTVVGSGITNTIGMTLLVWFKLITILVPPYVLAGMAIALALTRSPWPAGIVYGVDLIGAASGCLATFVLLSSADGVSALIAIAALAAAASVSFGIARRMSGEADQSPFALSVLGRGKWPLVLAVWFGAIALWNAAVQPTTLAKRWPVGLVLLVAKDGLELTPPAVMRWNSYSRIRAANSSIVAPQLWGPSPIAPRTTVAERALNIDGSAGTVMYRFDGDSPSSTSCATTSPTLAMRSAARAAAQ